MKHIFPSWVGSFFNTILALLFAGLMTGCASLNKDITTGWTVEKLYAEARDEFANGAFDKAIGYFEKLETRAIGTPLAQQAQIEKAYAQYKANEQAAALVTLDRFLRLHPASPLIDYVLYLRGLVNFNDNLGFLSGFTGQNLTERDQKASKESYQSFSQLATRFPNSKYTEDAKARMGYILNTLAAYELHVARYYISRGAYLAAANRAQAAISEYPNSLKLEEALEILIQSYEALNEPQLRDDTKRVMARNFPKNKLAAATTSNAPQKR
jgi:outer membrane protein assembly factor BamD